MYVILPLPTIRRHISPPSKRSSNIPVPNTSRHINGPEKIIIREPIDQASLNARVNTPVPNTLRHIPYSPKPNNARHIEHDKPETITIKESLAEESSSITVPNQELLDNLDISERVPSSDTSSSYVIPQTAGELVLSPSTDIHISSPAQKSSYEDRDIPTVIRDSSLRKSLYAGRDVPETIVIRDSPAQKTSSIYGNIPAPSPSQRSSYLRGNIPVPNTFRHV